MNIYKLSQDINNDYDTYDSVIVIAETEEKARLISPSNSGFTDKHDDYYDFTWVKSSQISEIDVELIGKAKEGSKESVVLASYNAG